MRGSILVGLETVLIFFFCPETSYNRAEYLNIDLGTIDRVKRNPHILSPEVVEDNSCGTNEPPWTIWEQLRIWRGVESNQSFWRTVVRPLPMLILPQVIWAVVTGLSSSWLSLLIGITALIYGNPPYNFTVGQLGLLGIGGLIASILGFVAGPLNDWLCKVLARRNNGMYEPEVFFLPIHR